MIHYLTKEDPALLDQDFAILVKIWANLRGLEHALHDNGSITTRDQMVSFAIGFNRSRAEFDFVDVGGGKENADSKMRRMLVLHYHNLHCKKIFFAGCHDTGYIHDLKEWHGMEEAEQRIVLVETTPAEPRFKELGFPITRFASVFPRHTIATSWAKARSGLN